MAKGRKIEAAGKRRAEKEAGKRGGPGPRVLLLGNGKKERVRIESKRVRKILEDAGATIVGEDFSGERALDDHDASLAVVLGGDGAILRAAHQMEDNQVPVIGVNLGRLGFLADLSVEELASSVKDIVAGAYRVTSHVMLDCQVTGPKGTSSYRALNDVVVHAGVPFKMTTFELFVDGEAVLTYAGDGLILSTAIGSTAHNLAAGGPILVQTVPAVVITPICGHALTLRPLVASADGHYKLRCPDPLTHPTMIVDGFNQIPLTPDHEVRLERSPVEFKLARLASRNYFTSLNQKLHWGDRPTK